MKIKLNMRMPKTIKGYIKLLRIIEKVFPEVLKGFDNLAEEDREILKCLGADISNYINEVEGYKNV